MAREREQSAAAPPSSQAEAWSLLSGEVHYWRLAREHWSGVLDAARSLGVECLGTYVPWEHHERADGSFDFAELIEFVELVRSRGFTLFARPGPYIYAEWRNLGVPDHAVPFAKHEPQFRERARRWIEAVLAALRPYLGDPIVLVQADNEIDPMPHLYGEDQGFARWLERRYSTVGALNAAWGTTYGSFADAMPSLARLTDDARYRDGQQYRYDLATDYARWVVGEFRRHVGAFPLALNTWPFVNAQHWRDLADLADVFGIDPYPENECARSFRELREQFRLLRAVTRRPFVAELGSGVWHGATCDFSPEHYRLTAYTALAAGVRGWNWYMLANRDHWSGGPIDERGGLDEWLAPAFRDAACAFEALRDAPPPSVSCAVTWSWAYHQTATSERRRVDDPLFEVLHELGIEHDYFDIDREPLRPTPQLVLVAGEIDDPARLWEHIERGGTAVFFQRLVEGCARPDGTSHHAPEALEVSLGFTTERPVFAYREVPGEPIYAVQRAWSADPNLARHVALAVGRRYLTGYVAKRGRGRVVVLGCAPSREAVLAVHRAFGFEIPALPETPGVHASRRGDTLVVLNPGPAIRARIRVGERVVERDLPRCSGSLVPLANA